ncbi:Transcriptional regulator GlxA family, contains an amidase domain and an AraC-type DNA-binding HTH domain [Arenibacter nanhaiticus]|uniref:Transcriptional regulator GlxA family, contains an amidase domain and an AraC-type DNA-binding HTH domain n=1 Tax=Arenibacter nanhaiticus TaxID=558155 RepID=A0A1M6C8K1_9FLAO|nr:GlxA family transcriptional regulator [Arenibacter nanhaiticus]SHI57243.1 Transcriptional regulator GlxA family, contains an amidase domain and an AraC-type DNA-binding HTH domain [Arenibacter nanhaiticus]
MSKKLIVIVATPDCLALDIIGPSDVFGCVKNIPPNTSKLSMEGYDILIASATKELQIVTNSGLVIHCQKSLYDIKDKIDTLIIGGFSNHHKWDGYPKLIKWLKEKHHTIRRICSVCIGAFVLAEGGFLKGKKATTHWEYQEDLKMGYDDIQVESHPIFVKDGKVYTSAGASAGIDLSLALVEEDYGRKVAMQIAQSLVLYLKRPGSQSQFSTFLTQQLSSKNNIREIQEWIMEHLKENLDVQTLADRALMSPRNFARVFLKEIGLTPAKYIEKLRIESSKIYLEETDFSMDFIAQECGFGTSETMRKTFLRWLQLSPFEYRKLFGRH